MENIISRDNPKIKLLSKLLKSKKAREEEGRFVLEGVRLVCDVLNSSFEIESLFITEECIEKNKPQLEGVFERSKNVYVITTQLSNSISDTTSPQGVYAICKKLDKCVKLDKIYNNGVFICLCSLQDPGNVGTIIRTAEALGVDGVLLTDDCPDVYSPKVLRSTMGSVFRIPTVYFENETQMLNALKENEYTTYAAVLDKNSICLGRFSFVEKSAVLIGNEANGLSKDVSSACDFSLYVPMKGGAESLNAATAANIIMWEMCK